MNRKLTVDQIITPTKAFFNFHKTARLTNNSAKYKIQRCIWESTFAVHQLANKSIYDCIQYGLHNADQVRVNNCDKIISTKMTKDKPQKKINSTELHPLTLLFVNGYICRKDHWQRKAVGREDRLSTDLQSSALRLQPEGL